MKHGENRSTCDRKHVGAVVVRDKCILATGYNGSVRGLEHCDDAGHMMEDGHCVRTVHAEANAVIQAARHGVRIDGACIYVTALPCWGCFKTWAMRIDMSCLLAHPQIPRPVIHPMTMAESMVEHLRAFGHGWDGEDAPVPTTEAIDGAMHIVAEAVSHGLIPSEIDADVLGGVAVWFGSDTDSSRAVWIACMNNGSVGATYQDSSTSTVRSVPYSPDVIATIKSFIEGGS